jgi:predicted GNAT family acetyltransferase
VALRISSTDDAPSLLSETEAFLASEPVRHNLILTLLHARAARAEPGRYWVARDGGDVAGVAFQSPLNYPVSLTPMREDVVAAIADAVFEASPSAPGVTAEAAVAARFAGCWTERSKAPARPFQAMRLYEVNEVAPPDAPGAPHASGAAGGRFRVARLDERDLVLAWARAFFVDIGEPAAHATGLVEERLPRGHFFVWEDGEPVSMAAHTEPVAGVVRVQYVYTPPERRAHGYALACVGELSRQMRARGHRCVLFADLENPRSNSIYRRLGYRPVAELVKYRFT